MTWQGTKTDWTPDDGVDNDDFNRIEGNTLDNHDRLDSIEAGKERFQITNCLLEGGPSENNEKKIGSFYFKLNFGEKLVLKNARWNMHTFFFHGSSTVKLKSGSTVLHDFGSYIGDTNPNKILTSFDSGVNAIGIYLEAGSSEVSSIPQDEHYLFYWLDLAIE